VLSDGTRAVNLVRSRAAEFGDNRGQPAADTSNMRGVQAKV
jgi:hypothetical protein